MGRTFTPISVSTLGSTKRPEIARETHPFAFEVKAAIEEAIAGTSAAAYHLLWELLDPGTDSEDVLIRLQPRKITACPVAAHAMEDAYFLALSVGRNSAFELPLKGQFPVRDSLRPLEVLDAVVRAAVEGRVQETVWVAQGIIIQSEATIDIPGEPLRSRRGGAYAPLRIEDAAKQKIDYEPYE